MEKMYITGHKNPDTDSVMSAIVAQDLYTKLGMNVVASKQGPVSKETKFAIERIGVEEPETNTSLPAGTEVILVDHNNAVESLDNIDELKIYQVIDHHAVKLNVGYPLYYRAEPVGCTCTILYKMYIENELEISKKIAFCMLSAIISDSLLFKSPTCTEEDIKVAKELEKIAGVNAKEYGLELLTAGTDLSSYTVEEILNLDAKTAVMNGNKITVGQITTANIPETLKRKEEFEKGIEEEIAKNDLDLYMLIITDIINSDSQIIALGKKQDVVRKAYNVELKDNTEFIKGLVSRKKQVIPVLTEKFDEE